MKKHSNRTAKQTKPEKTNSGLNVRYVGPAGEVEVRHDGGLVILSSDGKKGERRHQIVVRGGPYPLSSLFGLDVKVESGSCTVKEGRKAGKRLTSGKRVKLDPGTTFSVKAKLAVLDVKAKPGPGLGDGNRGDDELW
ncbi:MAG: hypothetical protein D6781_06820 [Verrucomicrobia bacterium]|nr:MAG: hypothetical protein D6781_06820 [Verrucomicrobiota bacterium]